MIKFVTAFIVLLFLTLFPSRMINAHSLDEVLFSIDIDKKTLTTTISWPQLTYLVTQAKPELTEQFQSLAGEDSLDQHLALLIDNQQIFQKVINDHVQVESPNQCEISFNPISVDQLDKPSIILGRGIPISSQLSCTNDISDGFILHSSLFEQDFEHQVTDIEVLKDGQPIYSISLGLEQEKILQWTPELASSVVQPIVLTEQPASSTPSSNDTLLPRVFIFGLGVGVGVVLMVSLKRSKFH